jgi:hypothetical protein
VVNAVNLPLQNALNFPAGFMAPPFFDATGARSRQLRRDGRRDRSRDQPQFRRTPGAMFDADGRLANWWTPADLQHFQEAGAQLAAQYDAYMPFPDLHLNGRQTLSENIADLAGLATAYDAWRTSLGGKPPDVRELHRDQQFFLAYAQTYQIKWREPALRQAVIADGHAPGQLPRRYRAEPRRLVRRLRRQGRAGAVPAASPARARLVSDRRLSGAWGRPWARKTRALRRPTGTPKVFQRQTELTASPR